MQRLAARILAVLISGMAACQGAHEHPREHFVVVPVRPVAVLDLPHLLSLDVDGLGRRLGPAQPVPATFTDPAKAPLLQLGYTADSVALFRQQGLRIVVSYSYRSRRVIDILLLGANEDSLMQRAKLLPAAPNYMVLPVFKTEHPTELLGVRVLSVGLAKGR